MIKKSDGMRVLPTLVAGVGSTVRVTDVSQTFSGKSESVRALQDINLEIAEGEFIALLGPSGCGKSTLLNVIAGLITPSSGSVLVDETEVQGVPDDTAMMFQKPVLLPWRTVLKNVLLPVELARGRRAARGMEGKARELLGMVGLKDFAESMPRELSGGMQQRAAICRMLIQEPRLLLLDEPFGALDEFTREHMNIELLRITSARRSTTIFVTHNISEAVFLADRVIIMSARPGRIAGEVKVRFDVDRDPSLLTTAVFQDYVREARDLLKIGHGASERDAA